MQTWFMVVILSDATSLPRLYRSDLDRIFLMEVMFFLGWFLKGFLQSWVSGCLEVEGICGSFEGDVMVI